MTARYPLSQSFLFLLPFCLFFKQAASTLEIEVYSSMSFHRHGDTNSSSPWTLRQTMAGEKFFDSWEFIERWDNTTHGATYYVNRETALKSQLAFVDPNSRVILSVDSKTDIPKETQPAVVVNTTDGTFTVNPAGLRKSVRLESRQRFKAGTLVLGDFHHVPYGCASWSAFWMFGFAWPDDGELDIFEGFNDNVKNRASLHTTPGCARDPSGQQTGKVLQESCDYTLNYNAGCGVEDNRVEGYGARFNELGGGVYAALYTEKAIAVWNWNRGNVPKDISADKPDPATWGTPVAAWLDGRSCDIKKHFREQNLAFNLLTCGDADRETYKQSKCPGASTGGTCFDHLTKGSNFKEVYFSIDSIKVFQGPSDYTYLQKFR